MLLDYKVKNFNNSYSQSFIMMKSILAVLGGMVLGGVLAWFAKDYVTQILLPKEYKSQLDRLSFHNKTQNLDLTAYKVLGHFVSPLTNIDFYVIGYEDTHGLAISDEDFHDVIVKLGCNKNTGEWSASIVHNGWDSIEIRKDGELVATFPEVGAVNTLYNKFVSILL
jgi:hypothetical protein